MSVKPKIAIVRGKFLNRYEMQFYEPLVKDFDITAFGSKTSFHDSFSFPIIQLFSPMDITDFPKKMPIINRLYTDAHYLYGLEDKLKGFDLVHTAETYFHYTQQCLNAKKKNLVKKVIATVLENIPFNNEGIHGRKEFKLRAREELDYIIALTERTKLSLLLEGASSEKMKVISHFIDTKRFFPMVKQDAHADFHRINILFCGRLEKYKGIYELLFALKLLLKDSELQKFSLMLTFVGDGSEKQSMLEMEKRLGIERSVTHTNKTYDEMPGVYQNAQVYVAPSKETDTWIEQYNTTLLEAQASGLPIVTTNSGGIPENVGEAGLYVQSGDVYSLVQALKKFILSSSLRKEYGMLARNRAERVHDISIGATKIAEVWNTVLYG